MNAHYRLKFADYELEKCGSHVVLSRGGKDWYRYDGMTTWRFDGELPVARDGFHLPSWEGITLLTLDPDEFSKEVGEPTQSQSELLGRPTIELLVDPQVAVIVDKETNIPLGIRSPREPLIPTSFDILPGTLDAAWQGPLKEIELPKQWAAKVVDKLPAPVGNLRIWSHYWELSEELQVNSTVPIPLAFSEGRGGFPGDLQTWRGWVHIDSAAPDPRWHGLFITQDWTASFTTGNPVRGDRQLTGSLSYFDSPDNPITYIHVQAIYGVVSNPDVAEKFFLPMLKTEVLECDGWKVEELLFDGSVAEPPPLAKDLSPRHGYILADDTTLWALRSQSPIVDAYDLTTGELSRQVAIPAPVTSHCALIWEEKLGVAVHFDSNLFLPGSGELMEWEAVEKYPKVEMCFDPVRDIDQTMLVSQTGRVPLAMPQQIQAGAAEYFRLDAYEVAGIIVTIFDETVRFFTPDLTETTLNVDIDFANSQVFQDVLLEYSETGSRFFSAHDLALIAELNGDIARIVRGSREHLVVLHDHAIYQWHPGNSWTTTPFYLQ